MAGEPVPEGLIAAAPHHPGIPALDLIRIEVERLESSFFIFSLFPGDDHVHVTEIIVTRGREVAGRFARGLGLVVDVCLFRRPHVRQEEWQQDK